jgi:hypothetical protein
MNSDTVDAEAEYMNVYTTPVHCRKPSFVYKKATYNNEYPTNYLFFWRFMKVSIIVGRVRTDLSIDC